MPDGDHLKKALAAVKWDQQVAQFLAEPDVLARFEKCSHRLAVWAKQFETLDEGNCALPFVRDAQASAQHVAATAALALYRPAVYGMRCLLEGFLYYSYFRLHAAELCTLTRDSEYYLTKEDILQFHRKHTVGFREREDKSGLQGALSNCYKKLSAVAHGQIPGRWLRHTSLSKIKHDNKTLLSLLETFEEVEEAVHLLLLCTVAQDLWQGFPVSARRALLKGLSGDTKDAIGLTRL